MILLLALIISSVAQVLSNLLSGSMDGYLTYSEILREIGSLKKNYPNLITLGVAGKTLDTEEINYIKLSSPESIGDTVGVLVTASQNSYHPLASSFVLYAANDLCSSYDKEFEKYLLKTRVFYFFPVINIYAYKRTEKAYKVTRKPKEFYKNHNTTACDDINSAGVDISRNWGYNWGYDDIGSSSDPCASNYRGKFAFSEAETNALRDFISTGNKKIKLWMHYDGDGNIYTIPYSYTLQNSEDIYSDLGYYHFYNDFRDQVYKYGFQVDNLGKWNHTVKNGSFMDYGMSKNIISFEVGVGFRDVKPRESKPILMNHLKAFKYAVNKAYVSLRLQDITEAEFLCGKLMKCKDPKSVSHILMWIAVTNQGLTRTPELSLQLTYDSSTHYNNSLILRQIFTTYQSSYDSLPSISQLISNSSSTYNIDSTNQTYTLNISQLKSSSRISLGFLFERKVSDVPSSYSFGIDSNFTVFIPSFQSDLLLSNYTTHTYVSRIYLNEEIPSLNPLSEGIYEESRSRGVSIAIIVVAIVGLSLGIIGLIFITRKRYAENTSFVGFHNSEGEASDNSEIVYENRFNMQGFEQGLRISP